VNGNEAKNPEEMEKT